MSKCGLGSNPAMMLCVGWGFWFCTLLQEVFFPRYYGFRLSPKTNAWFLLKWRVEHLCSANSPKAKGWIDDDHFYFCYHYCCVQENTYYTSFFSPAGFTMSRGYWSRMLGHFRLWPPSWTDWHTWPRSHAGIDPMPRKMNLDHPCQAALLWISKVRGYDRVCSRCSAKKTIKSQVIKQQNKANTLF